MALAADLQDLAGLVGVLHHTKLHLHSLVMKEQTCYRPVEQPQHLGRVIRSKEGNSFLTVATFPALFLSMVLIKNGFCCPRTPADLTGPPSL